MVSVGARRRTKLYGTSLALFCFSLFLTAYSAKHPQVGRSGAAVSGYLMNPLILATYGSTDWFSSFIDNYVLLIGVKEKNKKLQSQLEGIAYLNARLDELEFENSRLRKLLTMREAKEATGLIAQVIALDPSNWVEGGTIDKGSSDGVAEGMPVIAGAGVVGQIVATASHSSTVVFITDQASGLDAITQTSRTRGVLRGKGVQKCALEYVGSEEKIAVGDRIITSGLDGVYPKGILVGLVVKVGEVPEGLFRQVVVDPIVDFSRLEEVMVVGTSFSAAH